MRCPKCFKTLPVYAKFCDECGAQIIVEKTLNSQTNNRFLAVYDKLENSNPFIKIIAFIVVLFAALEVQDFSHFLILTAPFLIVFSENYKWIRVAGWVLAILTTLYIIIMGNMASRMIIAAPLLIFAVWRLIIKSEQKCQNECGLNFFECVCKYEKGSFKWAMRKSLNFIVLSILVLSVLLLVLFIGGVHMGR
jgi:hypothetical protein